MTYQLQHVRTTESLDLTDGDVQCILTALTMIAADCSHTATLAPLEQERKAFDQSAKRYRSLRDKLCNI